jgi:cyclophilin family peptidyl-prolyl cis-trans isomerase/protein-disulfide isomerase
MRTKTFFLFIISLLILVLLGSCSPQPKALSTASPSPTSIPTTPTPVRGCSAITTKATPDASSSLPPVTASDYVSGPDNAPVTMLLYCDFQSPQCEIFNKVLDQLQKDHPDDLKVVLRPYPLPASLVHSLPANLVTSLNKSQISTQAVLAAGDQGKFWEMRNTLDTKYVDWVKLSTGQFESWATDQAVLLGLDKEKFKLDLTSSKTTTQAQSLFDSATRLFGSFNIPTVFINGSLQSRAALSYAGLDSTISLIALGTHQFNTCPPFSIDTSRQYTATLHLEKGDILIQLYPDKAPLAVNSFVFLARKGWYDGVTFQRVIPGYLAQTGDPSGTGLGGPGYFFKNETTTALEFNKPGVVGMANSGPDTNGSQFFITYAPAPDLDGQFTIFGQVLKGMDVVEGLTSRDPSQSDNLPPGDKVVSVTIEEK